jgi:hypothetical protein
MEPTDTPFIKSVFTFDNLDLDKDSLFKRRPSFNQENEFARVNLKENLLNVSQETIKVAKQLKECIEMRKKYLFKPDPNVKVNKEEKVKKKFLKTNSSCFNVSME